MGKGKKSGKKEKPDHEENPGKNGKSTGKKGKPDHEEKPGKKGKQIPQENPGRRPRDFRGHNSNTPLVLPCPHCKLIAQEKVTRTFQNKIFNKALILASAGKTLTKNLRRNMESQFPFVKWYSLGPEDEMFICLNCGTPVDSKKYDQHFYQGHCFLALSITNHIIRCEKCYDEFQIEPGTFCGDLLGITKESITKDVNQRIKTIKPAANTSLIRGLYNIGNTCWMNSVLQCLKRLPKFIPDPPQIHFPTMPMTFAFSELLQQMFSPDSPRAIRPDAFSRALTRELPFFEIGFQHDAFEFLMLFLDKIRTEECADEDGLMSVDLDEVVSKLRRTPLDDQLAFIVQNVTTCSQCMQPKYLFERNITVTLCLPIGGQQRLEDLLETFFSETSTSEGGERLCDFCGQTCDAFIKPMMIKEFMPNVLIIHLSRFRMGKYGFFVKNTANVSFPEILDMSHYVNLNDDEDPIAFHYQLIGIVVHFGTLEQGHYVSVVKSTTGDSYFFCNDNEVMILEPEELLTIQPYMLFYQKI